jgi:hypothetical protein
MIRPDARSIVRYARRNNLPMGKRGTGMYRYCARAVLAHSVGMSIYDDGLHEKLGISLKSLREIECGFEGWGVRKLYQPSSHTKVNDQKWDNVDYLGDINNRYYKVGARVAELTRESN